MRPGMIRFALMTTVGLLSPATAVPAAAQGLSFVPSFAVSRIADDNVFYRPSGESDLTTRYSPRIDAAYDDGRLVWSSRYQLDADQFDRHPQLTTAHARQDVGVDLSYTASRRLSFAATAAFVESQSPMDLNLVAAPVPGRVRARRFSAQPSATYQLGPRTDAIVRYEGGGDSVAGGIGVRTDGATTTIEHHVSPRTDVRVEYSAEYFRFDGFDTRTSQAFTAEWRRSLDRATSVSIRVGPRVTEGVLSPDINATLHHRLRAGEAAITYLHTTTTLLGIASLADMHGVTASVSGEPRPRFRIHAGPDVLRTTQGTLTSEVYRLSAGCERPFAKHFAFRADYDVTVQRGNIYTARPVETIGRNRLLITVGASTTGASPR